MIHYSGNDWYKTTYFYKVFFVIINIPIIFILYISIINYWLGQCQIKINNKVLFVSIVIFLFFLINLYSFFQGDNNNLAPLGYGSIHLEKDLHAMLVSFVIGSLGSIVCFNQRNFFLFKAILLFFISTIIHPAMGICNLLFFTLFYFNQIKDFLKIKFLSLIVPLILLIFVTDNSGDLSSKEFFDIYVKERQPHHYIISNKIFLLTNYSFITWAVLLSFNLIVSYFLTNKKIFILFFKILILFLLIPIIQFLFVEILYSQIFIKIGISRFSTFLTLILVIQHSLLVIFFMKKFFKNDKNEENCNIKKFILPTIVLTLIVATFTFNKTYVDPMEDPKFKKYIKITKWINENLKNDNSVFFTDDQNILPSFVRIYANKNIFHDENMPFTKIFLKEYSDRSKQRKVIENIFKNGNSNDLFKFQDKIDYYIFSNENINNKIDLKVIYKDKFFSILQKNIN